MNDKLIESIKKIQTLIREDGGCSCPTNSVGGGNIAGVGVGPQGEPGGKKVVMGKINRRKRLPKGK
jgi:hypothetical protein